MTITVHYETLLKRALGLHSEQLELNGALDLLAAVHGVAERHGEPVRSLLLDASGELRRSLLIFVGDQQVGPPHTHPLQEGDVVTLMAPISGG